MKQLYFDEDIKYLFNGSKSFDLAQKVEGEIYREHANRITKKIIVNHKGYFYKITRTCWLERNIQKPYPNKDPSNWCY